MLAFARFFVLAFVVLTVIYGSLWFYLRARRRGILAADWEDGTQDESREAYVDAHMPLYDKRRFRLLIGVVYVLPCVTVATIIYLTNFH